MERPKPFYSRPRIYAEGRGSLGTHTSPLTPMRHCAGNDARQHCDAKGSNSYFLLVAFVSIIEMERG